MPLPIAQLAFLDQLRGFVAVGRRMSITMASEDLCLTQSAVSRQILALESQLGVKLLVRGYRSISFTPEGERLFRSTDGAIQQLQVAMGDVRSKGRARPVTLSASIGVAGLWLLPRLNSFRKRHPRLDLRISANNRVGDLRAEGIDLSIRYTTARLAPTGAVHLFGETIAPVAHPSLGIRPHQIKVGPSPQWSLLEFDEPRRPLLQWSDWLNTDDFKQVDPQGILRFNQYDQVIQAAVAGQGIALGRLELIQPMLDDGRLMMVSTSRQQPEGGHGYWLVVAEDDPRSDVQDAVEWIGEQARLTQSWTPE